MAVGQDDHNQRRIIEYLEPFRVRVRLIPGIHELVSGRMSLANLRDVGIEDLLGRDQVEPLPYLLERSVATRSVMVTGAGGSIGSELCRQILRQRPQLLVLLDQSEFGLYEIHRELSALANDEVFPVRLLQCSGQSRNPDCCSIRLAVIR